MNLCLNFSSKIYKFSKNRTGKWFSFIGNMKLHDDRSPTFIVNSFSAVKSLDQVTNHFLKVCQKYLQKTKESPNRTSRHIASIPSHLLSAEHKEKRIQDDLLAAYESEHGGPLGHNKQGMYDLFKNKYNEQEISDGIQVLENYGLLFRTIDMNHHRATKFNPGTTEDVFLF